ncbi:hypothetical protein KG112_13230 [Nocardioides sp. zg-ZUI104]|uniref:hypothetical protein n=1 Tax=Nocardioides faecalis TaxID=2803858 RepID=UPI001BD0EA85|nr:hypothetical protein [Nocardioides faecalis]MBS4753770.1 hypothetical protein [Nocardioides faecalis]
MAGSIQRGLPGLDDADLPRSPELLERAWAAHSPPPAYAAQYRRLAEAAVEAGIHPHDLDAADLASSGLSALAHRRGWRPATVSLYAKVARYAGIPCPGLRTPEPDRTALPLAPLLAQPAADASPAQVRVWVWLSVARRWPAPLPVWTGLRVEHLALSPAHRRLTVRYLQGSALGRPLATPADPAAAAWARWLQLRDGIPGLAESPWALPNTRRGNRPDVTVGSQPSERGLEAAFKRYVRGCLEREHARGRTPEPEMLRRYLELSYDTYRRHVMASDPVARDAAGLLDLAPGHSARGAVRAQRGASLM